MARGRKPAVGENRDQYLRVRLSKAEADKLDLAADDAGQKVSDHVRATLARDWKRRGIK
jgi:uncharacterized protein (DUF1778 family)